MARCTGDKASGHPLHLLHQPLAASSSSGDPAGGDEARLLPGRAGRGRSTTEGLGSSGDSSLLLTTAWPERSQLSGSQKLLDHSLAPFITPNRAVIHAGRLIIVEFTHPSLDNLWRRGWAEAARSSPAMAHRTRRQRRWHQCPASVGTPRTLSALSGFRRYLGRRGSAGSTQSCCRRDIALLQHAPRTLVDGHRVPRLNTR